MLNRSLRLAHTALALFAALLGFLFLHSFESYMPVGPAWYVDVVRPAQDKAPFSEINARIEAYARTRRLDVAKLVPDRKDPKGVEHLYVLAASGGSFAQSWMERGYGAFNAEISYKVHPRSEASALEPAGTYLLSGSREDLRGFRETLAGYGYNVDSYTETMTLRSLPWLFGGYALFGTAAVITLLIVALTGVGVAMNARAYGVQRLQGMTLRQAWALDARASLTFLSKAVGVLAVPLLAALYLYNSLHQLTAFLLLFAALGALGVLLTLCVHGVSLWILWHSSILDAIKEKTGFDLAGKSEEEIRHIAVDELKLEGIDESFGKGKLIDEIFGEFCEGNFIQPTFITDYPVEMSPLTKMHRSKAGLTERFELMINGKELANAYSELNDPIDQEQRFVDQMKLADKGDDEAMVIDYDFLRALQYGMPPTSGIGIGIDRLVMLMTGKEFIQEVMLFPQLKPEVKMPQSPVKEWAKLGVPEDWVYVLRKAGFNLISDIKDQKAQGLQQKMTEINKKYKLGYERPSLKDIQKWIDGARA